MMGDVEFPHPLDYVDKNGNAAYMKDESFYLNMDEGRSVKVSVYSTLFVLLFCYFCNNFVIKP